MVAQEHHRRLGKGPLEGGVPDFFAGRAQAFARRCLGTLAQATIGDAILHRRKAIQVVNFVEQPEAEDLADPRHGLSQRERVGVMVFGRLDDSKFDVA